MQGRSRSCRGSGLANGGADISVGLVLQDVERPHEETGELITRRSSATAADSSAPDPLTRKYGDLSRSRTMIWPSSSCHLEPSIPSRRDVKSSFPAVANDSEQRESPAHQSGPDSLSNCSARRTVCSTRDRVAERIARVIELLVETAARLLTRELGNRTQTHDRRLLVHDNPSSAEPDGIRLESYATTGVRG